MRTINPKPSQKDTSPKHPNADLYILSYAQNDINFNRNRKPNAHAPTVSPPPSRDDPLPSALKKEGKFSTGNVADRLKNIDRLVEMLKRGSKSKERDESACGRLFRLIEKMHSRYWRLHSWKAKEDGFHRIKTAQRRPQRWFNLKESLEMRENEIQKGSRNFELNELMHIVDLHEADPMRSSLSRELRDAPTPKKPNNNVYILRRKTKEDLSTRQDLNSNTHISSEQFLPPTAPTRPARSISHDSVDRSKSPLSVRDAQIDLAGAHSDVHESKLRELEIDSVKLDKSQEIEQEEEAVSNMKLPSFGLTKAALMAPVRPNRLIHPQPHKNIVFCYQNSQERTPSPRNEYFPPETAAKFMIPQPIPRSTTALATTPSPINPQQHIAPQPNQQELPTRLQRISSLQTLHPKSVISKKHEPMQNTPLSPANREEGSVESRRCYSMPKITFTYNSRQAFVNPAPPAPNNIHKNSPIFVLNQLKSSNQNANTAKDHPREDPYLSKNIQVTNIIRPIEQRPQSSFAPPKAVAYPANVPENHYNIPVNKYVPVHAVNAQPRPERPRIFNHQAQPSNVHMPNQGRREEYYGAKEVTATVDSLPSPNRERVRSTDTYVLSKPRNPPLQPNQHNLVYASVERERARSCNIKMEVVSRKQPMMRRVC